VIPVADITGVLWSKLLLNLVNPLNALSGRPLREDLYDRAFRLLWSACMKEGMQALRAAGIALQKVSPLPTRYLPVMLGLPNWLFLRLAKNMTDMDAHAKTSMAQDLERGRATEIDYLSGEIIELGKRCGVPTPLNEAVYAAVARVQEGRDDASPAGLYRDLTATV
jgi:2-dehydropantoate 2-reductase